MKKLILSGFFVFAFMAGTFAQNAATDIKKYGTDSVKCIMNLSLLQNSAKAKAYKDALGPWTYVYENCPASSKNIYIYGPQIYQALYKTETDAAKKKAMVEKVMQIYDKRIQYFSDSDAKGTILTLKGQAYIDMLGKDADNNVVYKIFKQAVDDSKEKLYPQDGFAYFMNSSLNQYKKDNSKKDQYLQDYFTTVKYLESAADMYAEQNDTASVNYLNLVREGIVKGFVLSGAGDCKTMNAYYADKLEPNKTNKDFLNNMIASLQSIGCTETDLFFDAAEYLYKLNPTANSAIGLAARSFKNKDYDSAMKYYEQAADLEKNKIKASQYLYNLAALLVQQGSYSKARQMAYQSLKYNPNNGDNYILIAQMYAATAGSVFGGGEKTGLVYSAAIDKLIKARSVDGSVAGKASSLISKYSGYLMDKSTAFMMGIKPGESVYIPGWIGETTTVRLK